MKDNKTKTDSVKAIGKWQIKQLQQDEFVSYLYASNGEVMLNSEIYASGDSAKKGIETIKKNVALDGFQIYCDKNKNYYFKVKTTQNRFVCVSETYKSKASCQNAMLSVKKYCLSANLVSGVIEEIRQTNYQPRPIEIKNEKYKGKWVIKKVDNMFMAMLFASNGELLLASESYTQNQSAKSAIETIKTNGINGNFVIDIDKSKRYYYKLRNTQKNTLAVGEAYPQLSSCENAIESVRRFLSTAILVEDEITSD